MPSGLQEPKKGGFEISLTTDLYLSFSLLNGTVNPYTHKKAARIICKKIDYHVANLKKLCIIIIRTKLKYKGIKNLFIRDLKAERLGYSVISKGIEFS